MNNRPASVTGSETQSHAIDMNTNNIITKPRHSTQPWVNSVQFMSSKINYLTIRLYIDLLHTLWFQKPTFAVKFPFLHTTYLFEWQRVVKRKLYFEVFKKNENHIRFFTSCRQ
jgi:hypothetical protein